MSFISELTEEIRKAEKRIEELSKYITLLKQVMEARPSDNQIIRKPPDESPLFEKTQFKNKGLSESILDLLAQYPDMSFSPKEITDELIKRGFETQAKSLSNNIRSILYLKKQKGEIDVETIEGKQRYQAKKNVDKTINA